MCQLGKLLPHQNDGPRPAARTPRASLPAGTRARPRSRVSPEHSVTAGNRGRSEAPPAAPWGSPVPSPGGPCPAAAPGPGSWLAAEPAYWSRSLPIGREACLSAEEPVYWPGPVLLPRRLTARDTGPAAASSAGYGGSEEPQPPRREPWALPGVRSCHRHKSHEMV